MHFLEGRDEDLAAQPRRSPSSILVTSERQILVAAFQECMTSRTVFA